MLCRDAQHGSDAQTVNRTEPQEVTMPGDPKQPDQTPRIPMGKLPEGPIGYDF